MPRQVLLASFIFTWCLVAGKSPKYGLLGGTITFTPGIKTPITEILWKHNSNKAVEFNGNEQQEYNSFKSRVILDWASAELNISGLRYEDSGNYILETYSNNELQRLSYTLKVIDKVPKPKIYCNMTNGDNSKSGHQARLTCSAEPSESPSLMKIEWTSHGQSGPELPILLGDEQDEKVYNCTVSNPLTKDSATFTAKDCYDDLTGPIVGIVVGVIFIVLCISLALFMWWKRKNQAQKPSDEEKTNGSGDEGADPECRRPLIHRSSTRPSDQRLARLNKDREDMESVHHNRKDSEQRDDEIKKSSPPPSPVANRRHSQVDPQNNEDLENKPADSVKATDVSSDEQKQDTQHQTADDLQSHTASGQPDVENCDDKVEKTSPLVPKTPYSHLDPHKNEPAEPVKDITLSDEQTEDTTHQLADNLQSPTASEQPENHDDKVKKTPPPVAKKGHSVNCYKNEPAEPMKTTDVSSNEQTEDTQHQSCTISKQPEKEANEDKKEEEHANTDQAAGKSTETNVREPDSTELGEGNKLDNISTEQEKQEKENSKTEMVKEDQQEEKEEEKNLGVDAAQLPHSPVTSK